MSQASPENEPTMDEILASIRKIISEDQPEIEAGDKKSEEAAASAEPEPVSAVVAEMPEIASGAEDTLETRPVTAPPEPAPEPEPTPIATSVEAVEAPAESPVEIAPIPEPANEQADETAESLMDSGQPLSARDGDGDGIAFPLETENLAEDYVVETPVEDDLISASARDALDQALGQLEEDPEPIAAATIAEGDSIEAVFARAVQQSLEPTLQNWVDGHGDEIVNRLSPLIRDWMDENLPPLIEAAVAKEISRAVRARRR